MLTTLVLSTEKLIKTFGEKYPVTITIRKGRVNYTVIFDWKAKNILRKDSKIAVFNREGISFTMVQRVRSATWSKTLINPAEQTQRVSLSARGEDVFADPGFRSVPTELKGS